MPDKRFANKRSPIQRERDELTISELYLKGWTQRAIADHLEVSTSQINATLKKIKKQWAKEKLDNADLAINMELKRLYMLEAEYWRGWERSQGEHGFTVSEQMRGGVGDGESIGAARVKLMKRTEVKVGDVRFLDGVGKTIRDRVSLRGLTPAIEIKVQELANAQTIENLSLLREAILADPEIPAEMAHKVFSAAAQLSERAALAEGN